MVVCQLDFRNKCLGEGSVDGVAVGEWCDVLRDRCAISGDDEGPVAV